MPPGGQETPEHAAGTTLDPPRDSPGGARGRLGYQLFGMIFALALVLRLGHVFAMTASPYFTNPVVDAAQYDSIGWAIAHGRGHPDRVFWHPPGYPYFLGWVWRMAGDSYLAPRLVQALLGALSVVLTAWIGARTFGSSVGLAAGITGACYGMLIYFDAELLAPTLTIFLMLVAVVLAMLARERRRRALWLAAGAVGGLCTLVVATSLIVPVAVAVWARRQAPWVLFGLALALAPATGHNYLVGREFVLVSHNGGVNFWVGNNPEYDRTVNIRADAEWLRLVGEPARAGVQGAAAQSGYFVRKSLAWAAREPAAFFALQMHKLRLLLSGHEIYRNHAIYPARRASPVLWGLLWKIPGLAFPFGLLVPLALLGLWVGARRAPLLAELVVGLALMVLAFFVTARYRVVMVPFLLIFAAHGVRWFAREAGKAARLLAGVGVAGLFLLANLGQGPMDMHMNADAEYSLAIRMGERGHLKEATALFESVLATRPRYAEAWLNLSTCYDELGRYAEAQAAMDKALAADPASTVKSMRDFAGTGRREPAQRLMRYLQKAVSERISQPTDGSSRPPAPGQ